MSILEDLYSGNLNPFESITPQDSTYRSTNREIGKLQNYFQKNLPPESKEKFNHLNQLMQEIHYTDCLENFSYGFRLGILLLLDVLTGHESTNN